LKYESAPDLKEKARKIVVKMGWSYIDLDNVGFLRSFGTSTRGTIARCHAMGKAMQIALGRRGFYVIEFISERFDKMSEDEQIKVIMHELMHIPKTFGGGFRYHDKVNCKTVEKAYDELKKRQTLGGFL
jgi:predicted metallopeptidase